MLAKFQALLAYRHAGRHMVLDARTRVALIAGSVVVLGADGCTVYSVPPPEPVVRPPVASIEIIPSHVSVPTGTTFTLQARVKDRWGGVMLDMRADSVSWHTTQGPSVARGPSRSVVINTTVPQINTSQAYSTAPGSIIVIVASMNNVSATDTIMIVAGPSGGTTTDWLVAPHDQGIAPGVPALPTIALIDGVSSGTQRNDSTFAFVQVVSLDSFDCNGSMCGEITMFSPRLGVTRDNVLWGSTCDFVSFVAGVTAPLGCQVPLASTLPQPIPVKVVIWKASSKANLDNIVAGDRAYATSVFNQPWTGLVLDVTVKEAAAATNVTSSGTCQGTAYDISDQLRVISPAEFQADRISVVYVDEIVSVSGSSSQRAFTCLHDAGEGPIILIASSGVGGSTLAHELGHAISEWVADSTMYHPDTPSRLPGFEDSNVMYSTENDTTRSMRSHFTLGQLYQMSLRDSSFVRRVGRGQGGVACPQKPDSFTPCPPLAKDMIR